MVEAHGTQLSPVRFQDSSQMRTWYSIFMFIGFCTFVVGLMVDKQRIWYAYLASFFFFVNLALGALFFFSIQYATSAGWSVNIRRFAECMINFLPYAFVAAVLFLFGAKEIYPWLNHATVAADPILQNKTPYLNFSFLLVRVFIFFGVWVFLSKKMIRHSLMQDEKPQDELTHCNKKLSIVFLLFFAISYSLFTVDLVMSLHPHWFSTIFGLYCFSGMFQSSLAMIILITIFMMRKGLLKNLVGSDHLHDLGKFLKAFTVFMAYIGFSQFMLIWYANLPEETEFYLERAHGHWMTISMSLLVLKFIVPFLALLPQASKRNPARLAIIAGLILIMQYVDVYWLIYPNLDHHHVRFSFWEIGMFLGFLGLFLLAVNKFLTKHSLIPIHDPRVHESLHHHVTY